MTTADADQVAETLRIGEISSMPDLETAADLWRTVWGGRAWPVQASLLRANAHAGNYVSAAWLGEDMVAASMGFLGHPGAPVLHSHITGVLADVAGLGVGRAIKAHQARWCRDHGIDEITWTFDPLVARNAWFNLSRLGVTVVEYLVDFYGDMPDATNRGQGSDRLHVTWDVSRPDALAGLDAADDDLEPDATGALALVEDRGGRPVDHDPGGDDHEVVTVAVPDDVEALRHDDADTAARWRRAVRDAMAPRLGTARRPGAWTVTGFTRDHRYVLARTARSRNA